MRTKTVGYNLSHSLFLILVKREFYITISSGVVA